MREALQCKTRTELESLLGKPRYELRGNLFGRSRLETEPADPKQALSDALDSKAEMTPDVVESYTAYACTIEIWFKDGTYCGATGFPETKRCDVILGMEL